MTSSTVNRRLKVYTKTGDKGTTSLYTGERRHKTDLVFEALGSVDELTSMIGLAREYAVDAGHLETCMELETIQSRLQDVNSDIATPTSSGSGSINEAKASRVRFDAEGNHARQLEQWIDQMDNHLPQLKNFILPSGGKTGATIHVARTICRRAERRVLSVVRAQEEANADLDPEGQEPKLKGCTVYLNRLSDYLFTAARFTCLNEGRSEVIYKKE